MAGAPGVQPIGVPGVRRAPVQAELDGMPRRLFPCTPTRLLTWLDCPRRYRFTYLDRPPPPRGAPWAHTSVGAATHTALAAWWSLPAARRTPSEGGALVRRGWLADGFRDGAQAAAVRERVAGWVEAYLGTVDAATEPVGVERTVSAPTATLVLSGRVDRLDLRPDGTLAVVDYKTGRSQPDADDARSSLALAVYAVAAARTLRRPCATVELHHLPSGTVAAAEHSPASLRRKVAEAESIAADVVRAEAAHRAGDAGGTGDALFPPSPSRMCSWCDYRRACPQGRAAAPELDPWAGLPD